MYCSARRDFSGVPSIDSRDIQGIGRKDKMSDRSSDEEEQGPGFAQYVGSDEEEVGTEESDSEMTGGTDDDSGSEDEPVAKVREADLKKSVFGDPACECLI